MSSRGSRVPPQRGGNGRNTRSRKNVLHVDLNALPHENHDHEGSSSALASSQDVEGGEQGRLTHPSPINVEDFDDDIFISSRSAFAEAKNNSRRNRGNTAVVDLDSEERTGRDAVVTGRNKRRRLTSGQTSVNNGGLFINLEGGSNTMIVDQPALPAPPPPQETTFRCPVCLGQLVDATSTKCGHIFCKGCLKAALAAQGKCPTCRKRSVMKDTIRIYLPATN